MTYQEFIKELMTILSEELPQGAVPQLSRVLKNNGLWLDCLTISSADSHISPAVYPAQYYEKNPEESSPRETAEEILNLYHKQRLGSLFDFTIFADLPRIRERIVFRLIHYGKNRELLETIPHIPYLDLAIIFYVLLPGANDSSAATVLIRNEHLKPWKIRTSELLELAMTNTPRLLEKDLIEMDDMIREVFPSPETETYLKEKEEAHTPPLYILTNRQRLFGSCCLLYRDLLEDFAEKCGSDLFVLPSSVHEVLLMPVNDQFTKDVLSQMVHQVNQTHVSREEFLSDHAYYYSLKEKKLLC